MQVFQVLNDVKLYHLVGRPVEYQRKHTVIGAYEIMPVVPQRNVAGFLVEDGVDSNEVDGLFRKIRIRIFEHECGVLDVKRRDIVRDINEPHGWELGDDATLQCRLVKILMS